MAACSKSSATRVESAKLAKPAAPYAITTDRSQYELRPGRYGPETTIVTTFTAPADKTVYLMNCNGAFSIGLERRVENEWTNAWTSEINGCASQPIVIRAGQSYTGTATVVSREEISRPVPAGTYRAVWYGVFTSYDPHERAMGTELPLEQRVSAPIVIRVSRDVAALADCERKVAAQKKALEGDHLAETTTFDKYPAEESLEGLPAVVDVSSNRYSHTLLDAMTSGGLGVAFFSPFSNERYFFPWRPIRVSPIGVDFFGEAGVAVLRSELIWVWIPCAVLGVAGRLIAPAPSLPSEPE
jgi:hypothetical protein